MIKDKKNNKEQPKVSVVIPTYNRSNTIGMAIKSVLNQTHQNFEIVIIDDSPNDKTERVVNSFDDNRIKYMRNKERTNRAAAINQGIRESRPDSKFIAFLDDDDKYLPLFLEKTIKKLEEKGEIIGVTCGRELRNEENIKIGKASCPKEPWRTYAGNISVFRKELFEKENYWFNADWPYLEEVDFGIRVLKNHKIECIPEILAVYYCHPLDEKHSLPSSVSPEVIEQFYREHYLLYSQWGRGALSYLCFYTGRFLLRFPEIKKGRKYLLKAFLTYPHPKYFLAYLVSLVAPGLYQKSLKILIYNILHPSSWKQERKN